MTIRCAWCKKLLGEKCGKCGSADVRKEFSFAHGVDYWRCFACRATWLPGAEDTSHGICQPPCPEAVKALDLKTLFEGQETGEEQKQILRSAQNDNAEALPDATGDSSEQGSGQEKSEAGETPPLPAGETHGE